MNIQRLPKVLTLCSQGRSIAGLLQGIPLLVSCTAQGHKKHRPPSKKKKRVLYITRNAGFLCLFSSRLFTSRLEESNLSSTFWAINYWNFPRQNIEPPYLPVDVLVKDGESLHSGTRVRGFPTCHVENGGLLHVRKFLGIYWDQIK